MATQRYQNLRSQDMPVREEPGATVRVFSGSSNGVSAPTLNYVPVTFVEITLEAGASVTQDLPGSYNGFLYILSGRGRFGTNEVEAAEGEAMLLGPASAGAPSEIAIHATEPMRVLLYAGEPLREPVVAYGPFVMNTKEQIAQAFEDYQSGKFAE